MTSTRKRRNFLVLGLAVLCLPIIANCTSSKSEIPILNLAIGKSSAEIDSKSSLKIQDGRFDGHGVEGRFFVNRHKLIYEDKRLKLELPECGAKPSMPTTLSFDDDHLQICSASILADYVSIDIAVERIKSLLAEIQQQGFKFKDSKYARFARVGRCSPQSVNVPSTVNLAEEITPFFVNADYCVKEMIAFILVKDGLELKLWLKNMRRTFPSVGNRSDKDVFASEKLLTDETRRKENVYYLELSFSDDQ